MLFEVGSNAWLVPKQFCIKIPLIANYYNRKLLCATNTQRNRASGVTIYCDTFGLKQHTLIYIQYNILGMETDFKCRFFGSVLVRELNQIKSWWTLVEEVFRSFLQVKVPVQQSKNTLLKVRILLSKSHLSKIT